MIYLMNTKDILINIKGIIMNKNTKNSMSELENKVNNFVLLHKYSIKKMGFSNIKELREFIEKIAIWYELKYPEEKVRKIINSNLDYYVTEDKNMSECDFYSEETFIESLPEHEKKIFKIPQHKNFCRLLSNREVPYFILTETGFIKESYGMSSYSKYLITDEEIKNKHIKDLNKMIKNSNICSLENNQIEKMLSDIEYRYLLRLQILNCAMYRIIERGGNRIGPRRAFLFANDFKINTNDPMKYGVDLSDDELMNFINKYLMQGGSKNLNCYNNYFHNNLNKRNELICLNDVIEILNGDKHKKIQYLKIKK